jgi:acyl-CoA synthetase (NDP forming)
MSDLQVFDSLFAPRSVAVIGASRSGDGPANNFIAHLHDCGFDGPIYPIHPSAQNIAGLTAYTSLSATPQPVDYLYVAVSAARVAEAVSSAKGRARIAQVISSGFGESEEGRPLQLELVAAARAAGVRVIGPNSLGTHAPRGRLTFISHALPLPGTVGVLSQSGGLAADIVRRGQVRGLRFSGVVSAGNCADVGICELLRYLLQDDHTRVIGLYLENAGEARELFEVLRQARARKPVVLLKGGRTPQGEAAAASHTGALASDFRLWLALCRQTGAVMVDSLGQFVDSLLAFQMLQPNPWRATSRVVLFGNGGGTSVLATDECVQQGLDVPALPAEALERLVALKLPPGSIVTNPIDVPANALRHEQGAVAESILECVHASGRADAVIMHVNMTVVLGYRSVDLLGNLVEAALRVRARHPGGPHFVLVLRSDGEAETDQAKLEYRARALARGIAVFDEPADAARALAALGRHERFVLGHCGAPVGEGAVSKTAAG